MPSNKPVEICLHRRNTEPTGENVWCKITFYGEPDLNSSDDFYFHLKYLCDQLGINPQVFDYSNNLPARGGFGPGGFFRLSLWYLSMEKEVCRAIVAKCNIDHSDNREEQESI